MTKQLFLNELAAALHSLPREERYRTLGYYDELIDDRMEDGQRRGGRRGQPGRAPAGGPGDSGPASCTVNMGSIDLDAFASPDITLSADSGNVTGTILGDQADYQIAVDTDMGSSNLADQMTGGPNTLEVTTNMGNIELAFEE